MGQDHDHKDLKRKLVSDDYESHEVDDEISIESTHKCNLCGKIFNNGQALGGHRRSHFHVAAKKVKTSFSNDSTRASFCDEYDGKPKCYVCKKKFPTKNALFGHMRSHPDRVCKGVSPPNTTLCRDPFDEKISYSSSPNNSSLTEDRDGGFVAPSHVINDLSESPLPRWKKKAKRGRKCTQSYEVRHEAAKNLMHLSGDCFYDFSFKKDTTVVSKSLLKPRKKREIGESSTRKEHVVTKVRFIRSSLKLGNISDGGGESKSRVENISSNIDVKEEETLTTSHSVGSKVLDFDLNKPCVNMDVIEEEALKTSQSQGSKIFDFDLNEPCVMDVKEEETLATSQSVGSKVLDFDSNEPLKEEETLVTSQSVGSKILDFDLNEPYDMDD